MTMMVRLARPAVLLAGVSLMAIGAMQPAHAQDAGRLQAIETQIRSLQGELNRMRRETAQRENETRAARQDAAAARAEAATAQQNAARAVAALPPAPAPGAAPAPPPVRLGMSGPRPTITSGDGRFSASVGAVMHFDIGGTIRDGRSTPDNRGVQKMNSFGTNLRRGRLPFTFRYDDFTLNLTPEFGGSPDGSPSLYEASINWNPTRPLTISAGYLKPSLTLNDSTSSANILFMERPAIVNLATSIAGSSARSAVGARWADRRFFVAGYLTGGAYGSQSAELATPQQTGGTFRVAGRPVASQDMDLHLGFSTSAAFDLGRTASGQSLRLRDRVELRIDNNRLIDTGSLAADSAYQWGPEFAFRYRNFMLQGEYIQIRVDQSKAGSAPRPDLNFEGGYVEASWVMTGETRSYSTSRAAFDGVRPRRPFNPREGGMGAFELVGRYSVADLNDHVIRGRSASSTGGTFGGRQEVIGVGVNWYPNNWMRAMLQWNNVNVDRLNAAGTTQIGQRIDTVAMRLQVAF